MAIRLWADRQAALDPRFRSTGPPLGATPKALSAALPTFPNRHSVRSAHFVRWKVPNGLLFELVPSIAVQGVSFVPGVLVRARTSRWSRHLASPQIWTLGPPWRDKHTISGRTPQHSPKGVSFAVSTSNVQAPPTATFQ